MSKRYGTIAFTDDVRAVQAEHGSETFYGRKADAGARSPGPDPLTEDEKEFLAERDGFYLASISETGWPYVQFRGGTAGFVHVLDDHTIGWADFRGNLRYVSTGNMAGDDRVALIAVDYAHRRRLKIFGHARIVTADEDADLLRSLSERRLRRGGRACRRRCRGGLRLELPAAHHPPLHRRRTRQRACADPQPARRAGSRERRPAQASLATEQLTRPTPITGSGAPPWV